MGVSPAGRGPKHHYSYATRLKTTPLHVSLKALMQLDVRQCLIVYVPQLMQPDLKQVGSVPLNLDPLLSLCICKPMQIPILKTNETKGPRIEK